MPRRIAHSIDTQEMGHMYQEHDREGLKTVFSSSRFFFVFPSSLDLPGKKEVFEQRWEGVILWILHKICSPPKKKKKMCIAHYFTRSYYSVADRGGGAAGAPLKLDNYVFNPICIRMFENKAQIAQENIKTTLELPEPLSGSWKL